MSEMAFNNTALHALLVKHASSDMLTKVEEVNTFTKIRSLLDKGLHEEANDYYRIWVWTPILGGKQLTKITVAEARRITDEDICLLPWIYVSLLENLSASDLEEGEIIVGAFTAEEVVDAKINTSDSAKWRVCRPSWVPSEDSFDFAYNLWMETNGSWIREFLSKDSKPVETPFPSLPASPPPLSPALVPDSASKSIPLPPIDGSATPRVRDAERFWPFMRCKNVYRSLIGDKNSKRLSHHDLLIWLANYFRLSVDELKRTDPYTLSLTV